MAGIGHKGYLDIGEQCETKKQQSTLNKKNKGQSIYVYIYMYISIVYLRSFNKFGSTILSWVKPPRHSWLSGYRRALSDGPGRLESVTSGPTKNWTSPRHRPTKPMCFVLPGEGCMRHVRKLPKSGVSPTFGVHVHGNPCFT